MKRKKNSKKFLEFLNAHKPYLGFEDWNITISLGIIDKASRAEVETDIWQHTLKVVISKEFFKFTPEEQKDTLFHELVHARYNAFSQKVSNICTAEEEMYINDISRGFNKYKRLSFKGEKNGTKRKNSKNIKSKSRN